MENVSKSGRVRKKSTRYADFASDFASSDDFVALNQTRKIPKSTPVKPKNVSGVPVSENNDQSLPSTSSMTYKRVLKETILRLPGMSLEILHVAPALTTTLTTFWVL